MPGSSRLPVSLRDTAPKLSKQRQLVILNLDLYVVRPSTRFLSTTNRQFTARILD
jgi:hypothetical protein